MANVKEIQDRIKSIQDTMKITNAMYMISSSKMKKAKKALSDTEPYFFEMQSAIRRILRHVPDIEHAFFDERPEIPKKDRKIGQKSSCSGKENTVCLFLENWVGSIFQRKHCRTCLWIWISTLRFRSLPCTVPV